MWNGIKQNTTHKTRSKRYQFSFKQQSIVSNSSLGLGRLTFQKLCLSVFHWRLSSIKGCLSSRLSFTKGCLPQKIVFHERLSYTKGCPPSKVILEQRLSSIKGCLPSMFVFHQRSSSINGHLPSKRLSPIKSNLWVK